MLRVRVPPLRERADDIEILLRAFAAREGLELVIDPIAVALLRAGAWPGNVRELENGVSRLAAEAEGRPIALDAELARATWPTLGGAPRDRLAKIFAAIAEALEEGPMPDLVDCISEGLPRIAIAVAGNRERAAALLGVKKASLSRRFRARRVN
jgi:DNA-binding NtrC family response regulator